MTQDRVSKPTWQGTFTNDELKCSIPFDHGRRLQGHSGSELFDEISSIIDGSEVRLRARKAKDLVTRNATIEALLANLLVAAFNRVEPHRFVAMPFDRNHYTDSRLSLKAMQQARDVMGSAGLLEGTPGFNRQHYMPGQEFGRRSRLRATPALREIFERCRVDRRAAKCSNKQVIRISHPDDKLNFQPPYDVAASASALLSINNRLEIAVLALPDEAWARVGAARSKGVERAIGEDPYIGDIAAISLYRSFKGSWEQGGRLYGGWWINLPKTERSLITIDGEATTELDYSRLHPTLLFARQGLRLDFDPYVVAGYNKAAFRNMGKRTFGRLVNPWKSSKRLRRGFQFQAPKPPQQGANFLKLRASPEDKSALPSGMSFPQYLSLLTAHLGSIAIWFGSDAGMTLQREDSDLAIRILGRLDQLGIVALPVHDSFIVKQSETSNLRKVMIECFKDRYFFEPLIKPPACHIEAPPLSHN